MIDVRKRLFGLGRLFSGLGDDTFCQNNDSRQMVKTDLHSRMGKISAYSFTFISVLLLFSFFEDKVGDVAV